MSFSEMQAKEWRLKFCQRWRIVVVVLLVKHSQLRLQLQSAREVSYLKSCCCSREHGFPMEVRVWQIVSGSNLAITDWSLSWDRGAMLRCIWGSMCGSHCKLLSRCCIPI